MSMQAVDIGASGGNPECGPLFSGSEMTAGKRWGGMQVDPRDVREPTAFKIRCHLLRKHLSLFLCNTSRLRAMLRSSPSIRTL
eukprot:SAG11_NODE_546_length_8609_cov_2.338778_3_plen_83_part_00